MSSKEGLNAVGEVDETSGYDTGGSLSSMLGTKSQKDDTTCITKGVREETQVVEIIQEEAGIARRVVYCVCKWAGREGLLSLVAAIGCIILGALFLAYGWEWYVVAEEVWYGETVCAIRAYIGAVLVLLVPSTISIFCCIRCCRAAKVKREWRPRRSADRDGNTSTLSPTTSTPKRAGVPKVRYDSPPTTSKRTNGSNEPEEKLPFGRTRGSDPGETLMEQGDVPPIQYEEPNRAKDDVLYENMHRLLGETEDRSVHMVRAMKEGIQTQTELLGRALQQITDKDQTAVLTREDCDRERTYRNLDRIAADTRDNQLAREMEEENKYREECLREDRYMKDCLKEGREE